MPRYLKVEWNGCSVSVRPIGLRRFFRFRRTGLTPYIVDDEIKLKIMIKQGKEAIQDDTLYCNEEISDTDGVIGKPIGNMVIKNKPNQTVSWNITRHVQSIPHDGFYAIYGEKDAEHRTIMSFHAYHSEKHLGILIILAGGTLAGIISLVMWLVSLFFGDTSCPNNLTT